MAKDDEEPKTTRKRADDGAVDVTYDEKAALKRKAEEDEQHAKDNAEREKQAGR